MNRMKTLLGYTRELFHLSPIKFLVNLALMVVLGMLEGIGIMMIVPLLMVAGIIPGIEANRGLTLWVNHFFESLGMTLSLPVVLVLYMAITLGYSWLQRYQSMLTFNIQQSYHVSLSIRLFRAVAYADWQLLLSRTKSDISYVLITELMRVYSGISSLLQMIVTLLITVIQIVLAYIIAPSMTCWVLVGATVLFILLQKFVKESQRMSQSITDLSRTLFVDLTEYLNGIKDVKSHGIESAQITHFTNTRNRLYQNSMRLNSIQTRTGMLYNVGATVFISLFLFSAIEMFRLEPQQLIVISIICARLWPKLSSIHMGIQNIRMLLPAFHATKELEEQCLGACENLLEDGVATRIQLKHEVEFCNTSFYYEPCRTNYAVEKVNCRLPVGTTTAFVGVSGSGKSTMVDLLIGLLRPVTGDILIDGEPLVDHLRNWRNSIGYVPQDPFLLNASIRENLLWSCPNAIEEEIWDALRLASVDVFVSDLPDGLNTVVGDRGVRMSGGERQRIVLARALLRKPSILILDEATSSLDSENEGRIQQAMDNLQGKMTIVVIAHRISTIKNADQIFVLEQGRIVEEGNYPTLMKNKEGRFYTLASA
jgi:ATP-binding cassette subfamily C protein